MSSALILRPVVRWQTRLSPPSSSALATADEQDVDQRKCSSRHRAQGGAQLQQQPEPRCRPHVSGFHIAPARLVSGSRSCATTRQGEPQTRRQRLRAWAAGTACTPAVHQAKTLAQPRAQEPLAGRDNVRRALEQTADILQQIDVPRQVSASCCLPCTGCWTLQRSLPLQLELDSPAQQTQAILYWLPDPVGIAERLGASAPLGTDHDALKCSAAHEQEERMILAGPRSNPDDFFDAMGRLDTSIIFFTTNRQAPASLCLARTSYAQGSRCQADIRRVKLRARLAEVFPRLHVWLLWHAHAPQGTPRRLTNIFPKLAGMGGVLHCQGTQSPLHLLHAAHPHICKPRDAGVAQEPADGGRRPHRSWQATRPRAAPLCLRVPGHGAVLLSTEQAANAAGHSHFRFHFFSPIFFWFA